MTTTPYAMTYHAPASQMAEALVRLSAFLLEASYAFLQTFHPAGHSEIDIFDTQQRLLLRVVLRQQEPDTPTALLSSSSPQTALTPEIVTLVQTLAQLWGTAAPSIA